MSKKRDNILTAFTLLTVFPFLVFLFYEPEIWSLSETVGIIGSAFIALLVFAYGCSWLMNRKRTQPP